MIEAGQITEDMNVVGSDGRSVGSVDKVEGDNIKLNRKDPEAGGVHHFIPLRWVESTDGGDVRLSKPSGDVEAEWTEAGNVE